MNTYINDLDSTPNFILKEMQKFTLGAAVDAHRTIVSAYGYTVQGLSRDVRAKGR